MGYAPIALFTYRRPDCTERLLASLLQNPEIRESRVFAFSDGARSPTDEDAVSATRRVLRACSLPHLEVIERGSNLGLANSVIDGVTTLCHRFGRVIVLEDDLVLSRHYLAYMNEALDRFAEEPRVFHVSGYMYPVPLPTRLDAVFLPFISSSGGWATWQRAWTFFDSRGTAYARLAADTSARNRFDLNGTYRFFEMLEAQLQGRVDSWAIRWYLTTFARDGLALFPTRSLAQNIGVGVGATHTALRTVPRQLRAVAHDVPVKRFPESVVIDEACFDAVKRFVGWELTLAGRLSYKVRRVHDIVRAAVARILPSSA